MANNRSSDKQTNVAKEPESLAYRASGPDEAALRAIERAAIDIEADVELVDAESALRRAIDRVAASKAALLFLAHLSTSRDGQR